MLVRSYLNIIRRNCHHYTPNINRKKPNCRNTNDNVQLMKDIEDLRIQTTKLQISLDKIWENSGARSEERA
jgi:hypothetical protein